MDTLNYSFVVDAKSHCQITLKNQPPYCHALDMAPERREPKLDQGLWLICMFAIWGSPQDFQAIDVAIAVAKKFNGKLKVGVRPFNKREELHKWCPEAKLEWISPTWLVFKNGVVLHETAGPQSPKALDEMLAIHIE